MLNKCFCGLLIIILTPAVFAGVFEHPASLENIVRELPQFESISCNFKQARTIPNVPAVLYSSGEFKYEKNKGVTFYVTAPVQSTVSYTSKENKQINNVINAISNKSYSKIEKDFSFYYYDKTLGLIPKKNSQAADYLKSVEITMDRHMITKMIIIAADSTKTTIWFR